MLEEFQPFLTANQYSADQSETQYTTAAPAFTSRCYKYKLMCRNPTKTCPCPNFVSKNHGPNQQVTRSFGDEKYHRPVDSSEE